MSCPKCRRNVQPEMPFATCPECWSALPAEKLSCGDPLSLAISHRRSFKSALDMGMIDGHLAFMESHFRLVENSEHARDFHYPSMEEQFLYWLNPEETEPGDEIDLLIVLRVFGAAMVISGYVLWHIWKF